MRRERFTSSDVDAMISIPLLDLGAPAKRVKSARQPRHCR